MEVVEREAAKGYLKLSLGERATSVDQAGSIMTDKGNETTPGARAYWCTGYRANNGFMKDPRTAASVASCLDDEGFINAGPTLQLPALSNVFAGGDICTKARFGGGERMAGYAHGHAISHLREYRTARRYEIGPAASDAPWYPDRNGGSKPTTNTCSSRWARRTRSLYAKWPVMKMFFQTPDAMEEKYGPIEEAPNGWLELGDLNPKSSSRDGTTCSSARSEKARTDGGRNSTRRGCTTPLSPAF